MNLHLKFCKEDLNCCCALDFGVELVKGDESIAIMVECVKHSANQDGLQVPSVLLQKAVEFGARQPPILIMIESAERRTQLGAAILKQSA